MNTGSIVSLVVLLASFFYAWSLWRKVAQRQLTTPDARKKAIPAIALGLLGLLGFLYFLGAAA
ncbi:hypothetical protein ABQE70_16480 [Xanthomonas campestris pv. campestris]|uniref:hypothetical protein n=1 Tax=Xanthomonas campestris TaxID=339 RepID=UPI002B2344F8|nr:hypothetical protein [Xanthomonas campestris]MEA9731483.1 hypothetical protein [Xanthomonas campestris]